MQSRITGFTLFELVITLAVAAIIVGMAAPAFTSMIHAGRAQSMADEFAAALNYARTEALKLSTRVSICASNDGTSCSGSWGDGWIIFQDYVVADNLDPVVQQGGVSNIMRRADKIKAGNEISVISSSNNLTYIRFTKLGAIARTNNIAAIDIDVKVAGCKGNSARQVHVSLSGMVSISSKNCE